jgi:hypothetical protein
MLIVSDKIQKIQQKNIMKKMIYPAKSKRKKAALAALFCFLARHIFMSFKIGPG